MNKKESPAGGPGKRYELNKSNIVLNNNKSNDSVRAAAEALDLLEDRKKREVPDSFPGDGKVPGVVVLPWCFAKDIDGRRCRGCREFRACHASRMTRR